MAVLRLVKRCYNLWGVTKKEDLTGLAMKKATKSALLRRVSRPFRPCWTPVIDDEL
jgi:hypothetical protein